MTHIEFYWYALFLVAAPLRSIEGQKKNCVIQLF